MGDFRALPSPAVVHFDPTADTGMSITMTKVQQPSGDNRTSVCPESHFQCPGNGYCLPVFLRCNGVNDCPGLEDEQDCFTYTCPDFYRCIGSTICLHAEHVCDGLYQCPRQDDELYCNVTCPVNCTCYGLAFTCPRGLAVQHFPDLRYLDVSDSGLTLRQLANNTMLVYLSLARCGLSYIGNVTLPNLFTLDLSDNELRFLTTSDLSLFPKLRELSAAGNPLASLISVNTNSSIQFLSIVSLDFSRIRMSKFGADALQFVPNLKVLNLSNNAIERLEGTFQSLPRLQVLDIRGCPVSHFEPDLLTSLQLLQELHAENYKLCCPSMLPAGFNLDKCFAPFDEMSSCASLLRSDVYRVGLSVFAALAILGNLGSFIVRLFILKQTGKSGFGAFVSHLCVSDFVMGVYLAIIGLADRLYRGTYLWEDTRWRHSVTCKVAGFLSLLSSEVSAFVVCFITLDRFLALRFPLSDFHFSSRSSHLACTVTWTLGVLVAAVPLLPVTSHWKFYSQTGICIPLPITRNDFVGRSYAFGVMIILNFVLFLLIAAGQVFIYLSIRANRMSLGADSARKDQDVAIARRLITIAVSDFLCWFPIGLLGVLASLGVSIPGEVSVSMAILVLPLNSALNPFLYNLNMLLERRRQATEQRLFKTLESQLLSQISNSVMQD